MKASLTDTSPHQSEASSSLLDPTVCWIQTVAASCSCWWKKTVTERRRCWCDSYSEECVEARRTCPCPRETEATSRFGFHCARFNHHHIHGYIWKFRLKRTLEVSLMAIIQIPVLCQASCRKMMNSSEDTNFKKLFWTILYSIFPGARLNWF